MMIVVVVAVVAVMPVVVMPMRGRRGAVRTRSGALGLPMRELGLWTVVAVVLRARMLRWFAVVKAAAAPGRRTWWRSLGEMEISNMGAATYAMRRRAFCCCPWPPAAGKVGAGRGGLGRTLTLSRV